MPAALVHAKRVVSEQEPHFWSVIAMFCAEAGRLSVVLQVG